MRRGLLNQMEDKMGKTVKKKAQKNRRIWKLAMWFVSLTLVASLTLLLLVYFGVLPFGEEKGFVSDAQILRQDTELLGKGLELQGVGRYCGCYLEDGTMEQVSDVMMLRIKNTTDQDLQLARLSLIYEDFTAEFEITNLPAGKTLVVLEKNRRAFVDEKYLSMSLSSVAFLQAHMEVPTDQYEITGLDGALNVKNISGSNVNGDIYIYYKYTAAEELYGGITFRVKIPGGLRAGELRQVNAEHFDPERCMLLAITSGA